MILLCLLSEKQIPPKESLLLCVPQISLFMNKNLDWAVLKCIFVAPVLAFNLDSTLFYHAPSS